MGKRTWAFGLVALAALTACSSSAKSTSSSSSGPTSTTSASGATGVSSGGPPADIALAQAAVLKLADFPKGWQATPAATASGNADVQLAKCLNVSVGALNNNGQGKYDSPVFSAPSNGPSISVSSSVRYASAAAKAQAAFALFSDPRVPGCLNTEIANGLKHPSSGATIPAGVTVGTPSVNTLPLPTFGDQSIGYRVLVPIHASGVTITITDDLVIAVKGRAGLEMNFQTSGAPFTTADEQRYTRLVVSRLRST
jgi:hypothetical protein